MSLYFTLTANTPDPLTEPKAKNPKMSDRSNAAIRKAIDLNPANRPQSIAEWFQVLGGFALSPQALQPLPDLSEPVKKPTGRTARTRQAPGASRASTSSQSSPPNISRLVSVVVILALALLGWNWLRGSELGTEIARTSTENTAEQNSTTGQSPTNEGSGDSVPGDLGSSGTETTGTETAGNSGNENSGNTSSTNAGNSNAPVQNPQTQTFLGLPVESFDYTSARVSPEGVVTTYEASRQHYIETKLTLPSGAEPLAMVAIEGGTFQMGSPENEVNRDSNEGPQRGVTVPSFFMGQYEVTKAQWFAVMGQDYNQNNWQERWSSLDSKFKGDDQPIVRVSWDDAQEFIRRLNQKTGKRYRLPTEAEWEYAARAGTTTPFSYGETITPAVVNYDGDYPYGNARTGEDRSTTIAVDSLYPNPWGLYHIHGNVWEWVEDEWYNSYGNKPPKLLENGSIAWTQDSSGISPSIDGTRVLRGGSWLSDARYTRSAIRVRNNRDSRNFNYGFRVVLLP